jgi:Flp pilus assembly protein TadB
MAQTKRKRRSKHRGTAAGTVEARGRTSRPPSPSDRKKQTRAQLREERLNKKPTWRSSLMRAAVGAAMMFLFLMLIGPKKDRLGYSLLFTLFALVLYAPAGYYIEMFLWRRRQRQKARQ